MDLKDILAISGKGGLYKFVSQGRNGIIVESFDDKKRTVIHSSAKVSALEDIAIFTETEEVALADVFDKIFALKAGKSVLSHKSSSEELKTFMNELLPDYDRDRVYVSDMKKLVQWYNLLLSLDLLKPEEKEEAKEDKSEDAEKTAKPKKTAKSATSGKPAKPSAAKEKKAKKETEE